MAKISVIIPVFNAQNYIQRCLNSIINQQIKDIEIICIDDCSKDNSLSILKKYAKEDKRIKILRHLKNRGEAAARNKGIKASTGDYIAFVDNDDTIDFDFLKKLYNKAKETNADIIKAEYFTVTYGGKKHIVPNQNKKIKENKFFFTDGWWSAIYKTNFIKRNNIKLPEGFLISGDRIFLNLAVLKANKVETVNNTYYCHFDRKNSGFSFILNKEKVNSGLLAIKIVTDEINKDKNIDKEGYNFIFYEQFKTLLNIWFHNPSEISANIYSRAFLDLYEKCKNKAAFSDNIKKDFPLFANALSEEKLNKIFEENKTLPKMLATNLRSKIFKKFVPM